MADSSRDPFDAAALAALLRAARTPTGEHLSEAQWERLACDEMTAAERDTALVHILTCEECATIHRSVMQLREGARTIETVTASAPSGAYYRRWSIAGGLVTAAAIVAALLINRPARVDLNDVTRSGRAGAALIATSPQSGQPLVGRRFAWQAVAAADSYELRVTTQDGVRVFTSRRDETSAVLPDEIELTAGTYYWRVAALKGDAEIAASPLIPFRVR